jgi:GxxExxY protein
MDLISEHNQRFQFFADITGEAMKVYNKYHPGLLESAYEAALEYLLKRKGYKVERQKFLPIFWDDVQLEQTYRMDLVVDDNIIIELKAVTFVDTEHRKQLWNYMNLTHMEYGMLINFGNDQRLFSEWYKRYPDGVIEKVRLY